MNMLMPYAADSREAFGLSLDGAELPARREALRELSRPVAGIHDRAKPLLPALVAQILQNEPFEDYPRVVAGFRRLRNDSGRSGRPAGQGTESFLRRLFPSLTSVPGIAFAPGRPARAPEQRAVEKARARYAAAGLPGQAEQLQAAYDGLTALRLLFGRPAGGEITPLEQAVPARYLGELLFAVPVWFIETKAGPPAEGRGSWSEAVRYFCDLGRTDAFAYLFQLYNNRPRPFAEFSGPDLMPLPLATFLGEVLGLFDYLVIATPYHGLAAAEWGDPYWPPLPDPFLFGFLRQVPELVFCLGRWSGTGLFPLIAELMADTAAHLRESRGLLAGYGEPSFSWYKAAASCPVDREASGPRLRPLAEYTFPKPVLRGQAARERWKKEHHSLALFADRVLQEVAAGRLFPWLRGEAVSA
jgi:hypothetical protein